MRIIFIIPGYSTNEPSASTNVVCLHFTPDDSGHLALSIDRIGLYIKL